MKDKINREIALLAKSLIGAFLLGIALASAAYFTLQYATENQVQAQKAAVASAIKTREIRAAELAQTAGVVESRASTSPLLPPVTPVAVPAAEMARELALASRIVPDGWVDYHIVDSGVTFAYPPHWHKADEDTNSVTFAPDISRTILVAAAKDGSSVQVMADGSTEMLKRGVLTFTPEDVDVTFHDEGILAAPYRPAYLTALMHVDGDPVSLLITYATDGKQILLILLLNNDLPNISNTGFAMVTQLVQSVSFHRDKSGSATVGQETQDRPPTPPTPIPVSANGPAPVP